MVVIVFSVVAGVMNVVITMFAFAGAINGGNGGGCVSGSGSGSGCGCGGGGDGDGCSGGADSFGDGGGDSDGCDGGGDGVGDSGGGGNGDRNCSNINSISNQDQIFLFVNYISLKFLCIIQIL
jgi:hypothetical protein